MSQPSPGPGDAIMPWISASVGPIDLATQERPDRLTACEAVVTRGLQYFIDVGAALACIRDDRLYAGDYSSFETYVESRWGFTRRRAYQLIDAARVGTIVHAAMGDSADLGRLCESHARALVGLAPEQIVVVYACALETTDSRPTAATVSAVRRDMFPSAKTSKRRSGQSVARKAAGAALRRVHDTAVFAAMYVNSLTAGPSLDSPRLAAAEVSPVVIDLVNNLGAIDALNIHRPSDAELAKLSRGERAAVADELARVIRGLVDIWLAILPKKHAALQEDIANPSPTEGRPRQ